MGPSGVEIDKPLPGRAPFILYFTTSPPPTPFHQPSGAGNSPLPTTLQTEPLWNRGSHSAWSVAHGVTTLFFPEMELPVKAFYGHQGVF